MARVRQIYQTDVLYVGPTGANSCTGAHFAGAVYGVASSAISAASGANMVCELFRVQSCNYSTCEQPPISRQPKKLKRKSNPCDCPLKLSIR